MTDTESPEHDPGYDAAVARAGVSDEEQPDDWYGLVGPRETSWGGGDAGERRRDRERLVNFVARYVREIDRKITLGQPGRVLDAVHSMEDAFALFERRTVMRWNRERQERRTDG